MYVSNIEDWVSSCVNNPRWLAECMQRIGRFGGQHPTANVLNHSLEVAWMLRHDSAEVQLWALYHDAHEVLTGDVSREHKTKDLEQKQYAMDVNLIRRFGMWDCIDEIRSKVGKFDKLCGDAECKHWRGTIYQHQPSECVAVFETRAMVLMQAVGVTK